MNGEDKLFANLSGTPVLIRAVSAFQQAQSVSEIIIAARPESKEEIEHLCRKYAITKLRAVVSGGESRQQSVLNAVNAVSKGIDIIAIHDGARPFVTSESVEALIALAGEKGAVIPAVRVKETVKQAQDGKIIATPDRQGLYLAQTPQVFLLSKYLEAVHNADGTETDDALLLEKAGIDVYIAEGDYGNIKITTPEDLAGADDSARLPQDARIGFGYDVHRLVPGRKLILCGVEMAHETGLLGHSDADAATHALMDALLGSLALGDIGTHFPDTDALYEGISSVGLLRQVMTLVNEKGFTPSCIDITIIAEKPKLAPYINLMRENIAEACGVSPGTVSVKATTEEGLGLAGQGIGAHAVCIVKKF
jgi:2-C-methyl-D-erythritol 2,4-cyclodiphosphate synthase/2-C-methyl-D-erythritol 4-phosphate cytidylyltransferase